MIRFLAALAVLTSVLQAPTTSECAIVFNSSVVYDAANTAIVETNCFGDYFVFQNDGNFVLRTPRGPGTYVWDSRTYSTPPPMPKAQGTTLVFENNGQKKNSQQRRPNRVAHAAAQGIL